MRISIRWKWFFAQFIIGIFVFLYVVIYLNSRLENHFESQFKNRWKRELTLAHSYIISQNFTNMSIKEADDWADKTGEILGMRVTLIDSTGKVIGDSQIEPNDLENIENHNSRPEIIQATNEGFGRSMRFSTTINQNLFYLALPINSNKKNLGTIRIAVPTLEIDESISRIHKLVWLASGFGLILVIIIGFFVSKSMTSRMHLMAETAKKFAQGDFSKRFSFKSNDELSELGDALNQMGTDLQKNMEQITNERDQLQTILNSMVEGVIVTDLSGKVLLINHSFEKIFNLTDSIIHKSIKNIFKVAPLLQALEKVMEERQDITVLLDLRKEYQKSLEAHIAILGTSEHPSGVVAVFHDTTKIHHLEKVRRDFVANVSHELRTPLTAIKGYIETLLDNDGLPEEKSNDFLRTVLKHSDRMAKLVEDLLSLSKLESIESDSKPEKININQTIYNVADRFSNIKEQFDLELKLDLPKKTLFINGIVTEIETAIENLIDNAIKYGSEGKVITVSATTLNNDVQISVIDKGIGIPENDQPRIFERFYRVDKGRSRALGGTGLGLSIVKHVIQRHHGRVWVESKLGAGSTFNFAIPKA